jgi:transcriptional regulator with XRE-family HTH domain
MLMAIYRHIGQTIRELREDKALSQEALAKKIGEPANTVSRWETGIYRPSAAQLETLAIFFGVSITVFFPGMENQGEIPTALLSATKGLKPADMDEVIKYAEFRKARSRLKKPRKGVKGDDD